MAAPYHVRPGDQNTKNVENNSADLSSSDSNEQNTENLHCSSDVADITRLEKTDEREVDNQETLQAPVMPVVSSGIHEHDEKQLFVESESDDGNEEKEVRVRPHAFPNREGKSVQHNNGNDGVVPEDVPMERSRSSSKRSVLYAITWPAAILSVSSVIDNPWSVCLRRSWEAGKQLADVLISREQGRRPVTLIGFSLGARVIFSCLTEMAKRGPKRSEGIVEDVVLLGAPVSGKASDWRPLRRVVAGCIVNGYSQRDWILKFLYRTVAARVTVAGLDAINWQDRRMWNVNLSDVVEGHNDYMAKLDTVLKAVGIKTKEDVKIPKCQLSIHTSPWRRKIAAKEDDIDGAVAYKQSETTPNLAGILQTGEKSGELEEEEEEGPSDPSGPIPHSTTMPAITLGTAPAAIPPQAGSSEGWFSRARKKLTKVSDDRGQEEESFVEAQEKRDASSELVMDAESKESCSDEVSEAVDALTLNAKTF